MSASTLLETPDGDWDLSSRGLTLTRDVAVLTAQKLRGRLQFFLGEFFADRRVGFPWHQAVFSTRNPSLSSVRLLLRRALLSVASVEAVERATADLDRASRTLRLAFSVRLDDGTTLLSGEGTPFLLAVHKETP